MTRPHIAAMRVLRFAALIGIEIKRDSHGMWFARQAAGWCPIGRTKGPRLGIDTQAKA